MERRYLFMRFFDSERVFRFDEYDIQFNLERGEAYLDDVPFFLEEIARDKGKLELWEVAESGRAVYYQLECAGTDVSATIEGATVTFLMNLLAPGQVGTVDLKRAIEKSELVRAGVIHTKDGMITIGTEVTE